MRVDFHLHTRLSDGALEPTELLAAVRHARLDAWAVTDHDSMDAFAELRGQAGLVPGVEATASHDGREVHVVGLGVDPDHQVLVAFLAGIRELRRERLTALIARLPESVARGLCLADLEDGRAHALGRNHLARALVRRGGAKTIQDAFNRHLADEHVRDPSLPQFPPVSAACAAIRAAGGIAILAHPGIYATRAAIEPLLDEGCDGLELAHPGLSPALAIELAALCDARGLFASCGSDLHFLGARKPGMYVLDDARRGALLARLTRAA